MCEVERKQEMKKSEIDGCATSLNGRDGRKEKVKVRNLSKWRRRKKSESGMNTSLNGRKIESENLLSMEEMV